MKGKTKRFLSTVLALSICMTMLPAMIMKADAADSISMMVSYAKERVGKTGQELGYNDQWCAFFVSDCAVYAGQTKAIPYNGNAHNLYFAVLKAGGKVVSTPKKGDLVFYNCSACDTNNDGIAIMHVGLVENENYSIEGNLGPSGSTLYTRKVVRKGLNESYSHGSGHNTGNYVKRIYVRPAYDGGTGEHTCNKGTYVYYEAAHPHYKCYECSICGTVWRNTAEPTIVSSCTSCVPEKVSDSRYSAFLPIASYTRDTGNITVYDSSGTVYSNRYISGSKDLCLILEIYTDGWCKVKYPSSVESSGYFLAYVPFSVFASSTSPSAWTCTGNYTTYRRSDLSETMHTVNNGDSCLVVGTSGGLKQIIHPTPINGQTCFMMGWVKEPKTHTHSYTGNRVYEIEHPHRISQRCVDYATCGGYIWTDEYYELKTCEQCWHATFNIGASSISVKVGESKTISASLSGCLPDSAVMYRTFSPDNNVVEVTIKDQQATFTGLKAGTTNFSLTVYSDSSKSRVIGTITIPVTVTAQVYTVSYNANGGTGAPASQTKTQGKALTLSSTKPTRTSSSAGSYTVTLDVSGGNVNTNKLTAARTTSYTFKNWNTAANGSGTSYASGASYTAEASATLYAQWNSSTATASVTLPTPTKTGATFQNWNTKADGSGTAYNAGASFKPSGNVTLYAIWKQMTYYTVSYNANGGTGAPASQTKTQGTALTLSSTKPTRTSSSAGSYTVTLDVSGGNVNTNKLTAARTTSYTFKNWNTAANGSGTSYASGASYTAEASATLYAQWNSSTATASVTLPTPTKTGATFQNWNTKADGSGTAYNAGASFTPSGNVTLYAIWKQTEILETIAMHRLYNPNSGEHFFTGSVAERNNLVKAGWNYEGVAWNAPVKVGDPVYRVFNPNSGDHHYTMSMEEVNMLTNLGWKYEGVAWNCAPSKNPRSVGQYRLYNPNADLGSHHYTSSKTERDDLVKAGWKYEGIGWYGLA